MEWRNESSELWARIHISLDTYNNISRLYYNWSEMYIGYNILYNKRYIIKSAKAIVIKIIDSILKIFYCSVWISKSSERDSNIIVKFFLTMQVIILLNILYHTKKKKIEIVHLNYKHTILMINFLIFLLQVYV